MGKKKDLADSALGSYVKYVPQGVRKYTDPHVKTAIKAGRRVRPWVDGSRAKGDAWVEAQKRKLGLGGKRKSGK